MSVGKSGFNRQSFDGDRERAQREQNRARAFPTEPVFERQSAGKPQNENEKRGNPGEFGARRLRHFGDEKAVEGEKSGKSEDLGARHFGGMEFVRDGGQSRRRRLQPAI